VEATGAGDEDREDEVADREPEEGTEVTDDDNEGEGETEEETEEEGEEEVIAEADVMELVGMARRVVGKSPVTVMYEPDAPGEFMRVAEFSGKMVEGRGRQ
jgi:hypothetical protein